MTDKTMQALCVEGGQEGKGGHTPGPWSIDAKGDIVSGPYSVAILLVCKPEDKRLMASAPELLDACKQAEAHIVELYNAIAPTSNGAFADKDVSVQQLRAAIARATPPNEPQTGEAGHG